MRGAREGREYEKNMPEVVDGGWLRGRMRGRVREWKLFFDRKVVCKSVARC